MLSTNFIRLCLRKIGKNYPDQNLSTDLINDSIISIELYTYIGISYEDKIIETLFI